VRQATVGTTIGENGRVYYVMEDIVLAGYTEDEALETY
jgi:hypothetical protein